MSGERDVTARRVLEMAALELGNCEATSDANADEQLELAAALRVIASRLDEEEARFTGSLRHCAAELRQLLTRLDADIPATPPPTPGGGTSTKKDVTKWKTSG